MDLLQPPGTGTGSMMQDPGPTDPDTKEIFTEPQHRQIHLEFKLLFLVNNPAGIRNIKSLT